jgi:hypothetical protein
MKTRRVAPNVSPDNAGRPMSALCDADNAQRQELCKLRSEGKRTTYSDEELPCLRLVRKIV